MEAKGLDRLDYFASQLAKNGVYYGWSHTFGFMVCPGNRDRLVAYDEIEHNLKGKTYAFMNFAEDVQDLIDDLEQAFAASATKITEPARTFASV